MEASDKSQISNKAERLAVAAAVAPVLRSSDAKKRRVTLYNQETGSITGYTTLDKAQEGILATAKIELAVQDDVRPKKNFCALCGKVMPVQTTGKIRQFCSEYTCNYRARRRLKRTAEREVKLPLAQRVMSIIDACPGIAGVEAIARVVKARRQNIREARDELLAKCLIEDRGQSTQRPRLYCVNKKAHSEPERALRIGE